MTKENQLQTLIDAAVRKAVEDTASKFESLLQSAQERNDGLAAKNRELLSEKKALEGKPKPQKNLRDALAEFDAETNRMIADADKADPSPERSRSKPAPTRKVDMSGAPVIDRADPRASDAAYYRAMQAEAKKRGTSIRYVDSRIEPDAGTTPKVESFDDQTRGIRWLRRDVADNIGIVRADRLARRDGLRVRTFTSLDDLPDETRGRIDEA